MSRLLAVVLAGSAPKAQAAVAFTTLHSFEVSPNGANPASALVQGSDGNFYGTTSGGGTNGGWGTVFRITPSGEITTLYSFTGGSDGASPNGLVQGSDGNFYGTTYGTLEQSWGTVFKITPGGALTNLYSFTGEYGDLWPQSRLVQGSDGYFYGTTTGGARYGGGSVFKIGASGGFTNLHSFNGSDGQWPFAGLVQGSDGDFYGTTAAGGAHDFGEAFKISADGKFTTLYSFGNGSDGAVPEAPLVQGPDGDFYGTTTGGGAHDFGTVFKVSASGAFTVLYSFASGPSYTYYVELPPQGGLVQGTDGNLYGTISGDGMVFKITPNGAFTSLYTFTGGNDGANPQGGLALGSDGNFYGTASSGGESGSGTVFKISASGNFTSLYSFTTSNDGANPQAGLVQGSDGNFYGTTYAGGAHGSGTVYKTSASGAFTNLYSFTGGNDGANPQAGLVQGSDGNFYGTTYAGGVASNGTVFKITSSGAFTSLYSFTDGNDGANPQPGLVQGSDGYFYGTAYLGGASNAGTVFKITSNGTFTSLYSFVGGNDGANPQAGLVQGSDGNFYGTTYNGGAYFEGTVFKITPSGAYTSLYSIPCCTEGSNPSAGLVQGSDGYFYGTTSGGGGNGDSYASVFKITASGDYTNLYDFGLSYFGEYPFAGLVQGSDGNFYGTAATTGAFPGRGNGIVFKITPSGAFTTLYSFTGGSDGANPMSSLVQGSDGKFYGTASQGGSGGNGVIFSLSVVAATDVAVTSSAGLGGQNEQFGFDITGPSGAVAIVQAATNLANPTWIAVSTNNLGSGGVSHFSDSLWTNYPNRFYRLFISSP